MSSAICGFSCCAVWPLTDATPRHMKAIAVAPTMTRLDLNFISPSLFVAHEEHESLRASGLFGMGAPQRSFVLARRISYHVVINRNKKWQCPKEWNTAKRQQGSSRGFCSWLLSRGA